MSQSGDESLGIIAGKMIAIQDALLRKPNAQTAL